MLLKCHVAVAVESCSSVVRACAAKAGGPGFDSWWLTCFFVVVVVVVVVVVFLFQLAY